MVQGRNRFRPAFPAATSLMDTGRITRFARATTGCLSKACGGACLTKQLSGTPETLSAKRWSGMSAFGTRSRSVASCRPIPRDPGLAPPAALKDLPASRCPEPSRLVGLSLHFPLACHSARLRYSARFVGRNMRRRESVAGIATITVWPLTAQAQRPSLPVIGFLNGRCSSGRIGPVLRLAA